MGWYIKIDIEGAAGYDCVAWAHRGQNRV